MSGEVPAELATLATGGVEPPTPSGVLESSKTTAAPSSDSGVRWLACRCLPAGLRCCAVHTLL